MQTLQMMRSLARQGGASPIVQSDARFLEEGAADQAAVLHSLDHWLRRGFVYRGENEEVIRTPEYMLMEWGRSGFFEGDCDDVATLYAAMLKALQFPCRFVAIRYDASPDFKHVFVEVWDGGRWVAVDPTVEAGTPYREIERMVLDV